MLMASVTPIVDGCTVQGSCHHQLQSGTVKILHFDRRDDRLTSSE